MQRIVSWQFRSHRSSTSSSSACRRPSGLSACLSGRRADRAADRHHLGLQAVFVVRPDRHLHLDDRLLGTAFFSGVLMIVFFGSCCPGSRRSTTPRWWSTISRASASRSADDMPVMVLALQTTPPRSAASCAPRCSTTSIRTMCAPRAPRAWAKASWSWPRAAQLDDPGGHRHRAWRPVDLRRRDHHRADLQGERAGAAADHGDPGPTTCRWCRR
jgi:hypothetical protein